MRNGKRPRISVITPVLNRADTIEDAVQSVLAQGYPDLEHVVVDDGSTDGTLDRVKSHPHLTLVDGPRGGLSAALNRGFDVSTGEIITYCNADDYYEPGAFSSAAEMLDRESDCRFVVGKCRVRDGEGNVAVPDPRCTFEGMLYWWLPGAYPCNPISYFYFREVQEQAGGFDTSLTSAMDYEFLLKASLICRFVKADRVFGTYRRFGKSMSAGTDPRDYPAIFAFAKRFHRILPPRARAKILLSYLLFRRARDDLRLLAPLQYFLRRGLFEGAVIGEAQARARGLRGGEADFGAASFLGYDLAGTNLRLHFRAQRWSRGKCTVFAHFYPASAESLPPRRREHGFINMGRAPVIPSVSWPRGGVFVHAIDLAALPAGAYTLRFGLCDSRRKRIPRRDSPSDAVTIKGLAAPPDGRGSVADAVRGQSRGGHLRGGMFTTPRRWPIGDACTPHK